MVHDPATPMLTQRHADDLGPPSTSRSPTCTVTGASPSPSQRGGLESSAPSAPKLAVDNFSRRPPTRDHRRHRELARRSRRLSPLPRAAVRRHRKQATGRVRRRGRRGRRSWPAPGGRHGCATSMRAGSIGLVDATTAGEEDGGTARTRTRRTATPPDASPAPTSDTRCWNQRRRSRKAWSSYRDEFDAAGQQTASPTSADDGPTVDEQVAGGDYDARCSISSASG